MRMKIRWKLLILLLAIALVPLVVASVLHRVSTRRLGSHLAEGTRKALEEDARRHLRALVDDYGRILERGRHGFELALRYQAREVEARLAAEPPAAPRVFFSRDFDDRATEPPGMVDSDRHFHLQDGKLTPTRVAYRDQVYVLAPDADGEAAAADVARLSTMPQAYQVVYRYCPVGMYWQYTAVASGVHTSYPGHGPYPPGYDPRTRPWYRQAKEAGTLTWLPPLPEVSTRTVTLGLAMPVRGPDGTFAGATAIDMSVAGIFTELKLPDDWSQHATAMLVVPARAGESAEGKLLILARKGRQERREDWQSTVAAEPLASDAPSGLAALRDDAAAGRSGVRRMGYRGRDAFWAYGGGGDDRAFPVVIVPYDRIVAQATRAEQYVLDRTIQGLMVTGIILLGVVAAVVAVAFFSSRSVTRPVSRLSEAAERLAAGEYETRVDIRTGDELQELGEVFNDIGPKLQERERMKRSLALAMEIQQHLLPDGPPEVAGFDVAGDSDYCDETGGDYYDFIDLLDAGPGQVGIAVGDVTGHGIGAALLMASARGVLRSHAGRHGTDLSALFEALNEHLVRDTGEERFMTLFYGVLDAEGRSLRWTSGGHDPPFLLRRGSGRIEELPNTGIPLGILEGAAYAQAGPITLETGDILLIGTDGIWEAANPQREMFGKQRLRDLLTQNAQAPAAEIHATVVRAVHDFRAAEPQADDITLVVIKAL